MSCAEWMNGVYYIRNKTEYNKVIKKAVAGYNEEIAKINDAIKDYKKRFKARDRIQFEYFNYYTGGNWRIRDFIEDRWLRRGGIEKVNTKTINLSCVKFDKEKQTIDIDIDESNWGVEYWWGAVGIDHLFRALKQVKWAQRGEKDGGYLRYWNEYHQCEGNGEPDFIHFFGKTGDEMHKWLASRPW